MAGQAAEQRAQPAGTGGRPAAPGTRALWTIALTTLILVAVDRASKWWVVEVLDLGHHLRIEVFPPYLTFVMAWNTGINFGLFQGYPETVRWGTVGVFCVISVALFWWTARRGDRWLALAGGVFAGGALGNAYDRVVYGAVADFLNMSCCGIDNPFAFNVADVAIFAGAAVLAWRA